MAKIIVETKKNNKWTFFESLSFNIRGVYPIRGIPFNISNESKQIIVNKKDATFIYLLDISEKFDAELKKEIEIKTFKDVDCYSCIRIIILKEEV